MTWAQRLKRVFKLDLSSCEGCEGCGGQVRVVACIEDPLVIGKILAHLETKSAVLMGAGRRPEARDAGSAARHAGVGLAQDASAVPGQTGRAALRTTGARGFLVAVISGHRLLGACYPEVL